MARFDPTTGAVRVFTFKEGMLSALAHDLEIVVGRFAIDVADDLAIDARFEAGSLTVAHAIKDGHPSEVLGASDKKKIEQTITGDVLDARRFPEIRFVAPAPEPSGDGFVYRGQLTLHGKSRPVEARSRATGGTQVAEIVLHQPDFGIKPYSAMLGALKIKPDIRVRIALPWVQPASAP